ncbi:bifunctional nicotinamide-nucleotide adenylyltransferase/Nudix hydroxylase [Marinibactrum halimedae]|uniref:ADP-ribose pyrophosphatase n=1 Tax=Marinibactrum halimedae TaxID=1444977 RepID=A0AA37WR38_9GAMM|nr:bifunctional nicotinamide-nucleotide adenylyltransferase/Nudix hydroxylase [Marinibactrum halimedae]MCD9457621.1 bifunctional nicotinamide-nucleotide adenylyltransferase/Nudix hydroxylase [Marinibactrum halimedae]GLS28042.1 ADP-ribose pyrophosphatase [Marinibactrum halimedae]
MSNSYDFLVFIGRFQPFHRGHLAVIQEGLRHTQQMIILCGSAHQPRTTRNPWSVEERMEMIRANFTDNENQRIHIAPLMDIVYNDEAWVQNVQMTVNGIVAAHFGVVHKSPKIGLIGHSKDQSSYYLKLFPQWASESVKNYEGISATPIRERILSTSSIDQFLQHDSMADLLSPKTAEKLESICVGDEFLQLQEEHAFIGQYQKSWENSPYPPTFVTVDGVVIQSGHVLMVERKARPGKGLLALPGGFVDQNETLENACLRELREETRLKVPTPVLKGSIRAHRVFDNPHRSARGRTITHAFYFELAPNQQLPKVKGGDDAKHAVWVPLSQLDPRRIYEDHYFIIKAITGL